MGLVRAEGILACLMWLAGCAPGPGPDVGFSATTAGARNSAILLGRIESFHREPILNNWVAGFTKISLTPANTPPFFNDLVVCPGRAAVAEPCGLHAIGFLPGPAGGQPWSSLNSFVMEVPAGTYSITVIEAPPYLWGLKPKSKSRPAGLTLKAGEVVNLGSIKAYFAQPQVSSQFTNFTRNVSTRIVNEADERGARAFLAEANPKLASAMVTRLLPIPAEDD